MIGLNFKGKELIYNHHLAMPFRPLVPHADEGIGESRKRRKFRLPGSFAVQPKNIMRRSTIKLAKEIEQIQDEGLKDKILDLIRAASRMSA